MRCQRQPLQSYKKILFYSFLSPLLFKKIFFFSFFIDHPFLCFFSLASISSSPNLAYLLFLSSSSSSSSSFFFFFFFMLWPKIPLSISFFFFSFFQFFLSFVVVMSFMAGCGCGDNGFCAQLWVLL